jgi:hypothetical protein
VSFIFGPKVEGTCRDCWLFFLTEGDLISNEYSPSFNHGPVCISPLLKIAAQSEIRSRPLIPFGRDETETYMFEEGQNHHRGASQVSFS